MPFTTSLTPLYSLPCSLHRQIVLIARDAHGKRKKYLLTGKAFMETQCECCPVLEGLDDLQIRGTQGFGFQKSHWDTLGGSLICVGIEWDKQRRNKKARSGFLKYFVNSKGQLDIYEWSHDAFKATGKLQVQLETSEAQACEAPLLLNSQIFPIDLKDCPLHGIVLNARTPIGFMRQFRWNRCRDQLEMIECRCRGESLKPSDDGYFELLREQPDGVQVVINKERKTMKKDLHYQKEMKPTVIRDLRAKSVEELAIIESSDQKLAEYFKNEQVDRNYWLLFGKERLRYSNDFLVEKSGIVFERIPGQNTANTARILRSHRLLEPPAQRPAFKFLAEEEVCQKRLGRPPKLLSMGKTLDQLLAIGMTGERASNVSTAYEGSGGRRGRRREALAQAFGRSGQMSSTSSSSDTGSRQHPELRPMDGANGDSIFTGTWSNPLPPGYVMEGRSLKPSANLKKRKDNEQDVLKKSVLSTLEFDLERNDKLVELVMADLSKRFSSDEQRKQIEERIRYAVILKLSTPNLPDSMTPEECAVIEKALRDSTIALEFEEFQKKLLGGKKTSVGEKKKVSVAEDFDWNDYELKLNDTVKGDDSDSEESDMDYDDSEDVKQMAPESVITRDDDDGCSVITDITDYSLLEEKE